MDKLKFFVASSGLLLVMSASAATYAPGFVWQRWSDWTPGAGAGTSLGNADTDSAGSPVWRYGYLTGGGLSSSDPWYSNTMQLAVWDDQWWGSNVGGVWARTYTGPGADNIGANPPIDRYTMWHDLTTHTDSYEWTSAVDWVNPVGNGAILNMSGSFTFQWFGHFKSASPLSPVEGVLTKYDASSNAFQVLWSGTYSNPAAGAGIETPSSVVVPVTLVGQRFDEGDYLRFTFRGQGDESDTPLWLGFRDGMYMRLVTTVPEPQSYLLMLAGLCVVGALAGRRCR